jgi:LPXTG-motif cell wall-anchored protein
MRLGTLPGPLPTTQRETVSVTLVQRALTVASRQHREIPSPGTVDGIYGPRTDASLIAFLRYFYEGETRLFGDRADIEIVQVQGSDGRVRSLELPSVVVDGIREFAVQYSTTASTTTAPSGSGIVIGPHLDNQLATEDESSNKALIIGLVVALALAGGGLWWLSRRRKGLRR